MIRDGKNSFIYKFKGRQDIRLKTSADGGHKWYLIKVKSLSDYVADSRFAHEVKAIGL